MAYYHFVLPHHSLRQPLETPEQTRGSGSPRTYLPGAGPVSGSASNAQAFVRLTGGMMPIKEDEGQHRFIYGNGIDIG